MTKEELEKRVRMLEELEAIKRLKTQYAQVCDDNFNPKEMVKLFTDDAEWIGTTDRARGREAIAKMFEGIAKRVASAVHYFMQPTIEINGDRATGVWYMWEPMKMADGKCIIISAIESDKYAKVNGEWLIAEIRVKRFFTADYEKAWE